MTGVPATPGKHIPLEVCKLMFSFSLTTAIAQVLKKERIIVVVLCQQPGVCSLPFKENAKVNLPISKSSFILLKS